MAKHHSVQNKYLTQWRKSDAENQLNIYRIPENDFVERGPGWRGFWRNDFNVLYNGDQKMYLPEQVAATIDKNGIEAIKNIDTLTEVQLSSKMRSDISYYVALQYIRTPRHREEIDKAVKSQIQYFMRSDISSPDAVDFSKKDLPEYFSNNPHKEKVLKKINLMSEKEIKTLIYNSIQNEDYLTGLTNSGHAKVILKSLDRIGEKLFKAQWIFLKTTDQSFFVSSDNPCFTISSRRFMNGILSPFSTVIFPLRPDLCIYIKISIESTQEHYLDLEENQVEEINQCIISNSYKCIIAKSKSQLEKLTKDFITYKHKKSRDVVVREHGPYTIFSIE